MYYQRLIRCVVIVYPRLLYSFTKTVGNYLSNLLQIPHFHRRIQYIAYDLLFANRECLFAYISAMLSGRLAGIAVRPFPLQSTMLLLQVHMAGQEPPPMLHGCRLEDSW